MDLRRARARALLDVCRARARALTDLHRRRAARLVDPRRAGAPAPVDPHRARARVIALAGLLAAATLASCGGDEGSAGATTSETVTEETTELETTETEAPPRVAGPRRIGIAVSDGVPSGGIVRETVEEGDRVVLTVSSDVTDEVHLHGYDVSRDVGPGRPARIAFRAAIPGRFEVELEHRGVQIAELTVEP